MLHYSRAAITKKGGRRKREEGGLSGVEGAGGLTGGTRCDWRWWGRRLAVVAAGRKRSRGLQMRREAHSWNCWSGWGESCCPGCLWEEQKLLVGWLLLLLLLLGSRWQRRRVLQRRERRSATTTWDGLVATWGGDDGENTGDDGDGGWRPRRREKGLVAGKLSSEGWFSANFAFDFLLHQVINGASIYRRWKRVISFTPG